MAVHNRKLRPILIKFYHSVIEQNPRNSHHAPVDIVLRDVSPHGILTYFFKINFNSYLSTNTLPTLLIKLSKSW